jgi:hypothetical protein
VKDAVNEEHVVEPLDKVYVCAGGVLGAAELEV